MPSCCKFPNRETRALQERTRLIREDIDLLARLDRRANHAERSAETGGRQSARVAVRQHRLAIRHQARAMAADRLVDGDVFQVNLLGLADQRGANLVEGLFLDAC